MERIEVPDLDAWRSRSVEEARKQEEKRLHIKVAACEVACGLHLAAGVAMMLFIDLAEQWLILLAAIAYCFLTGTVFGVLASAGGGE